MAIQTFTAAQVLTAAQMNALQANDYNQTVSTKTASYTLVAADKGTRVVMNSASATTITVNTSLFSAGDTLFLQNISTGVCTVTAGTATVSTAGSLAIPQNGSGILYFTSAGVSIFYPSAGAATANALTLVTATSTANTGGTVTSSGGRVTVAGSSSVSLNGVFTSTYHNYLVLLDTIESAASGPNQCNLRLRAAGSDTTSSTYYAGQIYGTYAGATGGSANNGVAQFPLLTLTNAKQQMAKIEVFSPQAATITTIDSLGVAFDAQSNYAGYQSGATQYDGFTLFMGASNFSGNITVYAYQKS